MRAILAFLIVLQSSARANEGTAEVVEDSGYERRHARDRFGRDVVFYLSTGSEDQRLPLAVFIQGSGCDSQFMRRDGRIHGGLQNILRQAAGGRVRVLVVEKPGVAFLDESKIPGTAQGCRPEFLTEHTLPRWAEAVAAAVRVALALRSIDSSRCLVVGHSEGGIVAARVAASEPRVSHVASLAGGGPTQLFDFLHQSFATNAKGESTIPGEWAKVFADPESITKFWKGHPYRRWSSFLASSPLENFLRTKAQIYIAHGTADRAVPVESFDVLYAELLAHGRPVTAERISGVGHDFAQARRSGPPVELRKLMTRVVDWFLDNVPLTSAPAAP